MIESISSPIFSSFIFNFSSSSPVISAIMPKYLIDNLIQEITQEYRITTVINTHDMNSVMEIGEKIIFLESGEKKREGSRGVQ